MKRKTTSPHIEYLFRWPSAYWIITYIQYVRKKYVENESFLRLGHPESYIRHQELVFQSGWNIKITFRSETIQQQFTDAKLEVDFDQHKSRLHLKWWLSHPALSWPLASRSWLTHDGYMLPLFTTSLMPISITFYTESLLTILMWTCKGFRSRVRVHMYI